MATRYVTEELGGPLSSRGTTFSYTYESHYDIPPMDEEVIEGEEDTTRQTHKVSLKGNLGVVKGKVWVSVRIILEYLFSLGLRSNDSRECSIF